MCGLKLIASTVNTELFALGQYAALSGLKNGTLTRCHHIEIRRIYANEVYTSFLWRCIKHVFIL